MANKKRVYEIAKEMGLGTRELVRILEILGTAVRSHMSTLEPETIEKVRDYLRQRRAPAKPTGQPSEPTPTPQPGARGAPGHQALPRTVPAEQAGQGRSPRETAPPAAQRPHGTAQPRPQGAVAGHSRPQQAAGGVQPRPQGTPAAEQRPAGGAVQSRPQGASAAPQRAPSGVAGPHRPPGQPRGQQPRPAREERRPVEGALPRPPRGQAAPPRPAAAPAPKVGPPARGHAGAAVWEREKRKEGKPAKLVGRSYLPELEEDEEARLPKPRRRKRGRFAEAPKTPTAPAKRITLEEENLTVQELAGRLGRSATEVIRKLIDLGIMAGVNDQLDRETAALVAGEFGVEVRLRAEKPATEVEEPEDDPTAMRERPPVVTVMGHVDHGKTSLLDAIRHTNVTAQEAGGITQHIGAYQVQIGGRKITFIDTPGHEAFTTMRARGAQVTDIAVLVVAADDGVMPQTVEAINHARAADVPIVVAINKIDRPDANPERVKQQLAEHGLIPEEWGGDTVCVPVSALKKQGLEELLEIILLVADLQGLAADPTRPAKGVVLEAELDRGRGPVATVLVQKGTLRTGDNFVVGTSYGRVRAMLDDQGRPVSEAGPSTPVRVLGLAEVPEAGDVLQVVPDEKTAREVAEARQAERRRAVGQGRPTSLEDLFRQMGAKEAKELKIIVKADVHGSVEAVRQALERLGNEEVRTRVIHGGVGAITESDVMLAAASQAIIVGFNVRPEPGARKAAEEQRVEIRLYRIIYELLDEMRLLLSGLLEPEVREVELGRAEVRATFHVPRVGVVAGCYVLEGKVAKNALARLVRDGAVVYQGRISSLKRFKDDVREVAQGYECGIGLENFNDVKIGDVIEAYAQEKVRRQL